MSKKGSSDLVNVDSRLVLRCEFLLLYFSQPVTWLGDIPDLSLLVYQGSTMMLNSGWVIIGANYFVVSSIKHYHPYTKVLKVTRPLSMEH